MDAGGTAAPDPLVSWSLFLQLLPWGLLAWIAVKYLRPLTNNKHSTFPHEVSPGPSFIRNKQGLWLYTHVWLPSGDVTPKGLVFYAHGFGGHSQRQWELGQFVAEHGYPVFALDHQGFGRSEGDRGHVEKFEDYIDDYDQFVDKVLRDHPQYGDLPMFIIGSSMGGNIAMQVAERRPEMWNGVILLAPAIIPHKSTAAPWMITAARIMSQYLPKFIPFPANPWRGNRDPDMVNSYVSDPLVFSYPHGMRARWGWEMLKAMDTVSSKLERVEWPFIVFQGTEDIVTNAEGCEMLYQKARSKDKTYRELAGWAHALVDEPPRRQLFKEIVEWISQRTAKSKSSC